MSRRPHVVVVGDVVLDQDIEGASTRLCPDAPVPVVDVAAETSGPGGAGLAALLCRDEGAEVTLVAPWSDDEAGRRAAQVLEEHAVELVRLPAHGPTRVKTRVRANGQPVVRFDRGGPASPAGPLPARAVQAIVDADVVLVSCYGSGTSAHDEVRALLADRARHRPVVWDPHPRGAEPVPGTTIVTPNRAEAEGLCDGAGQPGDLVAATLLERWDAAAVALTSGSEGAWLATTASEPLLVPTTPAHGDSCGAGDRFAAAVAVALGRGRTPGEAVTDAVAAATTFVTGGGTSGYRSSRRRPPTVPGRRAHRPDADTRAADAAEVVRRVRAADGVVVATGGCFDGLHAGHVRCLQAARELGDALVVLLNSDDSVRRRKGPGRPVHGQDDRVSVLEALACVDAVHVFDEDDPVAALAELRPDVWAKGGDYEDAELPEAPVVRSWGGRVVLLPYLSGRSTTGFLQRST